MAQKLEGKVAAVTGGTRGIGRSVAEALLDAGMAVAICGRSEEGVQRALAELSARGKVAGCAADVSRCEDVSAFFQLIDRELGGPDVLVNNAGVGLFASTADLTLEQWRVTLDTNLSGAFYCSKQAIPRMRNRGGGFIVNISSLAGKNAFAGGAAYNASKFGLNGFSEAIMLDHRYEGIRVSYVMPGSVDTDFGSGTRSDWKIAPEDVAEVILMLLRMPERTLVSRVEMRPTKPKK